MYVTGYGPVISLQINTILLNGNTYQQIKFATNKNWKILGNFYFEDQLTVVLLYNKIQLSCCGSGKQRKGSLSQWTAFIYCF